MGLRKTIQGIGTAELLAREAGIRKVLIICPASLKSQWNLEIQRCSARPSQLVMGSAKDRRARYANDSFFTICNYEQVLRDIMAIEAVPWDLIILDEDGGTGGRRKVCGLLNLRAGLSLCRTLY